MKNFHKRHSANQSVNQTDPAIFSIMDSHNVERSPLGKLRARHGFGVQLGAMTSLLALAACGSSSSTGSTSGDGGGAPSGATRPVVEMPVDAQSASIGDSVSINIEDIFSSPNGDALVYMVSNLPDWLRYDPATNSLVGSPNAEDVAQDASFTVTITAMNTIGESVDTNVEFTLTSASPIDPDNEGNTIPTRNMDVAVASEIIVTQGDDEAVVELANSFEDPDADAEITYTVALVDENGEETTDLPEWLIFDPAAGTVTVDPAYQTPAGQAGGEHADKTPPGIYILRVYALDGDKLDANGDPVKSAPITITLEVRPDLATVTPSDGNEGNTAPNIATDVAMPDAIEVTEDLAFSYTPPANLFTDADGDTLTYYAYLNDEGTDAPLPMWMSFSSSSGTLTGKPTLDEQAGTYVIHLYAVDGNGGVSPAYAMTVNVTAANDAPIAGDLVNQESGSSDGLSSYDIAGHFTDEEGDALTYSYAVADADGNDITSTATWLTMEGSLFSVDPAAAGEAYGVYTILVTASDGTHMSSAAQFTWELVEEFEGLSFASQTETLSAAENQTAIGAIALARGDVATEDSRVYSLVDGGDSDLIRIDPDTGVLSFLTAPDFEKQSRYDVTVLVTDGLLFATKDVTINVTNVDEGLAFRSDIHLTAAENQVEVDGDINLVSDPEGSEVSYSFVADDTTDNALFNIDTDTGALTFIDAPDFETRTDYKVRVRADDGSEQIEQVLTVNVTNVDEAPTFRSDPVLMVVENETAVTLEGDAPLATDTEGNAIIYSLAEDDATDNAMFTIDPDTGGLSFISAPDYENADGKRSYSVKITASDGEKTTDQLVTVTVTDIDEAPVFAETAETFTVDENVSEVGTIGLAVDPDEGEFSYWISGGASQDDLWIDANTGQLYFEAGAANYERNDVARNADGDAVFTVEVSAGDADGDPSANAVKTVTVIVQNVAEGLDFTSADTAVTIDENHALVGDIAAAASDEAGEITYTLSGSDAAAFTIAADGELSFKDLDNLPDFESDKKSYSLTVTASLSGTDISKNIVVNIANVNEMLTFLTTQSLAAAENQLTVSALTPATDIDGDDIYYSITGGADSEAFEIDAATGALTFVTAPNFESEKTRYEIDVTASDREDGSGFSATSFVTIHVENIVEGLAFASADTAISVDENQALVGDIAAAASDEAGEITYALGGADAAAFTIAADGELSFQDADNLPDFESDKKSYSLTVTASLGDTDISKDITVNIANVNEAPNLLTPQTLTAAENQLTVPGLTLATDPDGDELYYSITGTGDWSSFEIDATTGVLTFVTAPDFEGEKTRYEVEVIADDRPDFGGFYATSIVTIDVTDVNDAPVFAVTETQQVSLGLGKNLVTGISLATDEDAGDSLTYSISGTDAANFMIDPASGELRVSDTAEPTEVGDILTLTITATDAGGLAASSDIAVTVVDANEAPSFLTPQTLTAAENQLTVSALTPATDPDGDDLYYSITGGADQAAFEIDATTGALNFKTAPDFEGEKTSYELEITARDRQDGGLEATSTVSVNVTDVTTGLRFSQDTLTLSHDEGVADVATAIMAETEGDPSEIRYSITGGTDSTAFTMNNVSGILSFVAPPDFESDKKSYQLEVTATQGELTAVQTVTVNIADVNEAPSFLSPQTLTAAENQLTVSPLTPATDIDGDDIYYSITAWADEAAFEIDTATGALTFVTAPDFEGETTSYEIVVAAWDRIEYGSGLSATSTVTINVENVVEGLAFAYADTAVTLDENHAVVGDIGVATSEEAGDITYALSGSDAAAFTLAADGELSFQDLDNLPDFESDKKSYSVTITATQGETNISKDVTVNIANIDEAPSFADATETLTIDENTAKTAAIAPATDPEGGAVRYSITGGADSDKVNIDATTGEITFNNAPNFESPTGEANPDDANEYQVIVRAHVDGTDEALAASKTVTIQVQNVVEGLGFTSADTTVTIDENQAAVGGIAVASSDDAGDITYVLSGTDAVAFAISADGELSFKDPNNLPDFESDKKSYSLTVTASLGDTEISKNIVVNIANVNEGLTFPAEQTLTVKENELTVTGLTPATDADGDQIYYSITGGEDEGAFEIDASTGALRFVAAPDFESGKTRYVVGVSAMDREDGSGFNAASTVTVNVENVVEGLDFTSDATTVTIDENQAAVGDIGVATSDETGVITYALSGADAAAFTISADGELGFKDPNNLPDFESDKKSYSLTVTASLADAEISKNIVVNIADVNEGMTWPAEQTLTAEENQVNVSPLTPATDADGDQIYYSITGGADEAAFEIDAATGALVFVTAPDFEGEKTSYEVVVTAWDREDGSGFEAVSTVTVNVTDVTTGLRFSQDTLTLDHEEGVDVVATAIMAETEGDPSEIRYSITGGADSAAFTIDNVSGVLSFVTTPDFESDKKSYELEVTATQGEVTAVQTVTVNIANLNEAPSFLSPQTLTAAENQLTVSPLTPATDEDGDDIYYSIYGGADNAAFTINATTGALSFKTAPDFEGDKTSYVVDVAAWDREDGSGFVAVSTVTVNITDVNEAPTFAVTEIQQARLSQGDTLVTGIILATDEDAGDTITYSLSGTDAADFMIDPASGEVRVSDTAEPVEVGYVYSLTITATDAGGLVANSDVVITVADPYKAPSFGYFDTQPFTATPIGDTLVSSLRLATDPDTADDLLSYSLSGTDADLFEWTAANNEIHFKAAPVAADIDKTYSITLTATDPDGRTDTSDITVTVISDTQSFADKVYALSAGGDGSTGADLTAEELRLRPELEHVNIMAPVVARINEAIKAKADFTSTSIETFFDELQALITSQSQSLAGLYFDVQDIAEDLTQVDTHHAINMQNLFQSARNFNQDIGGWDTSNVENMSYMFNEADAFNQDISAWDVSKVAVFFGMLNGALAFDQNLGDWDLSAATNIEHMFGGSAMSTENLDLTLRGWSKVDTLAGETKLNNDLKLGDVPSPVTDATAVEYLKTTYNWDLSGVTYDPGVTLGTAEAEVINKSEETGNLIIHGLGGGDVITGGKGDDYINAGAGNDFMTGGDGADIFAFSHADVMGYDTIRDFDVSEGDKLDLSQLLFGDVTTENLSDYITVSVASNGNTVLTIDRDTAAGADNYANTIFLEGLGGTYSTLDSLIEAGVFIL